MKLTRDACLCGKTSSPSRPVTLQYLAVSHSYPQEDADQPQLEIPGVMMAGAIFERLRCRVLLGGSMELEAGSKEWVVDDG